MKRILTASVILITSVIICLSLFMPATGAAAEREIRIADKTGDWGGIHPHILLMPRDQDM